MYHRSFLNFFAENKKRNSKTQKIVKKQIIHKKNTFQSTHQAKNDKGD